MALIKICIQIRSGYSATRQCNQPTFEMMKMENWFASKTCTQLGNRFQSLIWRMFFLEGWICGFQWVQKRCKTPNNKLFWCKSAFFASQQKHKNLRWPRRQLAQDVWQFWERALHGWEGCFAQAFSSRDANAFFKHCLSFLGCHLNARKLLDLFRCAIVFLLSSLTYSWWHHFAAVRPLSLSSCRKCIDFVLQVNSSRNRIAEDSKSLLSGNYTSGLKLGICWAQIKEQGWEKRYPKAQSTQRHKDRDVCFRASDLSWSARSVDEG